jgi:predicted nucleic acid-binding protein
VEGLTLDAGALIAFERHDRRLMAHLKEALQRGIEVTIPTVVVAEAWRGGSRAARLAALLAASVIEPLDESLARVAGEAMGEIADSSVADAIVMASAALRGDRVLTTDHDDMSRLAAYFRGVRILKV